MSTPRALCSRKRELKRVCVTCMGTMYIRAKSLSHVQLSVPARLLSPWDSPGKNTGVGCHALLQGVFLTQGSNPGLLHCRQILYPWTTYEAHGKHREGQITENAPLKMDSEGKTWTCSMKGGVYQADECFSPGMRQWRVSTEVMLWCCSVAKSCPTLWPMDCSTPGLPVLHYLQEFAQTHPLSRWCFLSILSSAALVSLWAGFILGALRVRKSYQCVFFSLLLSHSTVTGESTATSGHNQEQSLHVFLPPLRGWQATQVSPERLSWKDTGR